MHPTPYVSPTHLPGRLEVQVEVGKPEEGGRAAILRIHAEKMRDSGRLSLGEPPDDQPADDECSLEPVADDEYEAWIAEIAAKTEGFSGAAIAAVVRAAVARALDRSVTQADLSGCRTFHEPSMNLP